MGLRAFTPMVTACPGCGRTTFNLQEGLMKVRQATGHLTGLKIDVMGCIVNGPGEMADADFGYVGAAPGRVSRPATRMASPPGSPGPRGRRDRKASSSAAARLAGTYAGDGTARLITTFQTARAPTSSPRRVRFEVMRSRWRERRVPV